MRLVGFGPVLWLRETFFFSDSEWDYVSSAILACFLSGLVFILAFPPVEWGVVAWIGLAPLIYQLFGRSFKQGFWLGYAFGLTFFYSNLFWLNTLHVFASTAPLGILALAFLCAIFTGLFGGLSALVLSHTVYARYLFVPLCWAVLETLRGMGVFGFPWVYLAHTQVHFDVLTQVVDLTGTAGLSGVIVLVNLLIADGFRRRVMRHTSHARFWVPLALGLVCIGGVVWYGHIRLSSAPTIGGYQSGYVVGVVQPGIKQVDKYASVMEDDPDVRAILQGKSLDVFYGNLMGLAEMRRELGDGPADLYILPESAIVNYSFSVDPAQQEMVGAWSRDVAAPILFGATRVLRSTGEVFNSAFLATPDGGVDLVNGYDKMHLVPFGEHAPYFNAIPGFTSSILGILEFTPGREVRVQVANGRRIGPLICFESCFPYLFRKYEKAGVDVFAVMTNDAWYGMSSGARRHQVQSVFRAIETRRPVIRVANTGISCMIDSYGRLAHHWLPLEERMADRALWDVPFRPADLGESMTLYMRYGEWFSLLGFVFCVAVMLYVFIRHRRVRGESPIE